MTFALTHLKTIGINKKVHPHQEGHRGSCGHCQRGASQKV